MPASALAIISTYYGNGAYDSHIDDLLKIRAAKYTIFFEMTYFFASSATKFAIAFTTIPICVERKYYWVIVINVAVMLVVMVFCLGLGLGNCTPMAATWNPALYVLQGNEFSPCECPLFGSLQKCADFIDVGATAHGTKATYLSVISDRPSK